MNKYINYAFICNDNLRVTFDSKGKVLRLLYPNPDHKQFINYLDFALKINGNILYLNDGSCEFSQKYLKNTNILETTVLNKEKEIQIVITDFCPKNEDVYIRNLNIYNLSNDIREISVIVNSNNITSENYEISGYIKNDALIQYARDYSMSIFSKSDLDKIGVNNMESYIRPSDFSSDDYIGLSNISAISFTPFYIKPKSNVEFPVFIHINDNSKNSLSNQLDTEIIRLRKNNIKDLLEKTKKEDMRYVRKHSEHKISNFSEEIQKIYIRSLLLFPVLYNNKTGGYSAAIEVDEKKEYSGRYSFSWPRDTFFAILGYRFLNYDVEIEKYYLEFLKKTQSKDGSWEQRFYTDGILAPSWGMQIDETALVIAGALEYFLVSKNKKFLKENFNMLEKAVKYLIKYSNSILSGEEIKTYDIWETYKGENTYSLGSIFYGLNSMLEIYKYTEDFFSKNKLKKEQIRKKKEQIEEILPELKRYIFVKFYDEDLKTFKRAENDKNIDISSILLSTIFGVFSQKEKKITTTIEKIDEKLKTESGGYKRFENDTYIGGKNPWPMGNLWMSLYYIKANNKKKALENFNYVVKTASSLGFLAEQVSNETKKVVWVNALGWMHGLFIYVLDELFEKGWI